MSKLSLGLVVALLAVSGVSVAYASAKTEYQHAYQKASAEHHKALELQNAWTTTGKTLKAAKKAAAKGKYGHAKALAERAYKLADLAVGQAKAQRTAWHQEVPK